MKNHTNKIILAMCLIILTYANAVTPVKKPKQNKCVHSHGRLKIVFGGRYPGMIDHVKAYPQWGN